MSRFARDIHVGSHVQQGDVIGYVGMTGLATGPHLHYEYLMNGVHMDPQTVKLPGADPLPADALAKFRAQTARYLADLASPRVAHGAQSSAAAGGAPANSGLGLDRALRTRPQSTHRRSRRRPQALRSRSASGFSVAGMAQYVGEPRGAVN